MNKTKYTCAADSRASLLVVERDMDRLSFITEREGSWTGSAWLTPEATADLARRLAEHVGLTGKPEPEPEPKPFKRNAEFEDVRKGDLVRSEWVFQGTERRIEGIAYQKSSDQWWTSKGGGFNPTAIRAYGGTLTILSRPETELPTTPGAVVVVGTKTYALEERTADLIWRNLADPTDFYSYEWPGDNDWTATGLKVVVA